MQLTQERVTKSCCGSFNYYYVTNEPLVFENFKKLERINPNIKLNENYKHYGMVFFENSDFSISGSIGSNKLRIISKNNYDIQKVLSMLKEI